MKILSVLIAIILIFPIVYGDSASAQETELLGAGATFAYPLYSKVFNIYYKSFGVRINYQSIGSGGGIRQMINKTVDFGATDVYMTEEEQRNAKAEVLHIPIVLGPVAVTYKLPDNPEIRLTPEVLSNIYLGNINKWDDPEIRRLNMGIVLPDMDIIVVRRSDGSGTTAIFTDYLTKVSEEWAQKVGTGKSVNWPSSLGAKGNEGVSGLVKQIPGSIGYVELAYAVQNLMPVARIQNKSGRFVVPSIESTSLALNIEILKDTKISLTNTDAVNGYPITGLTWVLIYKELEKVERDISRAEELVRLVWWMIHEGQKYAEVLDYAPLPKEAVLIAENILKTITYNNEPVFNRINR